MKIGRVGAIGKEKPVVFLSPESAVYVDSLVKDWSRETLEAGAYESVLAAKLDSLPPVDLATT